jgi:hypothetical protein
MKFQIKRVHLLSAMLLIGAIGCSDEVNPRVATRLNLDASLTGDLPSNPFQNKVITSWINKQDATMSTLYGNDVAVQYARSNSAMQYPAGSVLSVVTWTQQEDPRWFGGDIPKNVKSVEFVTVTGPKAFTFDRYEGSPLQKVVFRNPDELDTGTKRAAYLLEQRAAVMP